MVVKGRVAHCHIGELTDVAAYYRTGIEFVDLSDHARNAISDFVLAMKYAQSPPTVVDGEIAGRGGSAASSRFPRIPVSSWSRLPAASLRRDAAHCGTGNWS